jgi:hypothetical protein
MKRTALLLALVVLLLLAGRVLAMSSDNYRLDWFIPLTGSGGTASSTNYAISFTVGQSGVGTTSSTSYGACLGYWCAEWECRVYLPLVMRNFSS